MKYNLALAILLGINVLKAIVPVSSQGSTFCLEQQLVSSLLVYEKCLQQIMKTLFFDASVTGHTSITFLKQYCDTEMGVVLEGCQDSLEAALGVCLNERQRQLLDTLKSANWAGLHYICRDSASHLIEFREQQGQECMKTSEQRQAVCIKSTPLLSMYIDQYQGSFCEVEQPQGLACLKNALSEASCTNTAVDFIEGYYRSLVSATPCRGVGLRSTTVYLIATIVTVLYVSLW